MQPWSEAMDALVNQHVGKNLERLADVLRRLVETMRPTKLEV